MSIRQNNMSHFFSRPVIWLSFLVLVLAAGLRFYKLDSLPPSLYWEEAALGYDAYSILQTGRDFHGASWPIVAFESFGDWKPSLYFYAVVPAIAVFGLNEWAVRVPSAIAGLVIVVGVGLLARKLGGPTAAEKRMLVGMAIAAISPWAILFSRGGWESNLATALIVTGVTSFIYFIDLSRAQVTHFSGRREPIAIFLFIIGVVGLCASMYAYHAARLVAPLLGLGLICLWWVQNPVSFLKRQARFLLLGAGLVLVVLMPILISLPSVETQQRFNETNIFADLSLLQKSQQLQAAAGNTIMAGLVYHRYVINAQAMIQTYLSHFSLDFLFIKGDANLRHSIQFMGHLYHLEFVFVLLGVWWLLRQRQPYHVFLFWWLLIGIIPASITHAAPHALRILPTMPVWLLLVTAGIGALYEIKLEAWKKIQRYIPRMKHLPLSSLFAASLIIIYSVELLMFWRFYTKIYPNVYGGAFNDGYKQMILAVETEAKNNPELPVVIMRSKGRPSVYYWFYTKTDPSRVQVADAIVEKDQGEYLTFENVTFPVKTDEIISPSIVAVTVENYTQLVGKPFNETDDSITIIRDTYQRPVWVILKY
jgi:4-amino-4-deoxy-L-arabinose transferase-like glycosyltransferase